MLCRAEFLNPEYFFYFKTTLLHIYLARLGPRRKLEKAFALSPLCLGWDTSYNPGWNEWRHGHIIYTSAAELVQFAF